MIVKYDEINLKIVGEKLKFDFGRFLFVKVVDSDQLFS